MSEEKSLAEKIWISFLAVVFIICIIAGLDGYEKYTSIGSDEYIAKLSDMLLKQRPTKPFPLALRMCFAKEVAKTTKENIGAVDAFLWGAFAPIRMISGGALPPSNRTKSLAEEIPVNLSDERMQFIVESCLQRS